MRHAARHDRYHLGVFRSVLQHLLAECVPVSAKLDSAALLQTQCGLMWQFDNDQGENKSRTRAGPDREDEEGWMVSAENSLSRTPHRHRFPHFIPRADDMRCSGVPEHATCARTYEFGSPCFLFSFRILLGPQFRGLLTPLFSHKFKPWKTMRADALMR